MQIPNIVAPAFPVPIHHYEGTKLDQLPSVWKLEAEIEWLIADMIPLGGVTLISAPSGTGKTWLAHAIGGAVAHGTPFLGHKVRKRPVVYLDGENPLAVVKRNLNDLGIAETEAFKIWGGWWKFAAAPGPGDAELVKYADAKRPLFIWDSLVHFHSGDEQSATETRKFMKLFRSLADAGATVIILHHTGKTQTSKQYRGSSDIEAAVDMAYTLEGTPKEGKLYGLNMKNFKSRFAAGKNFSMQFRAGLGFEGLEVPQKVQMASAEAVVAKIIAASPGINGAAIKARAKEQGIGRNAVDNVLKTLPRKAGKGRERLYSPADAAQVVAT